MSLQISPLKPENKLASSYFEITFNRLIELKEIDPDFEDEEEVYYPSDYAFSLSMELLNELNKKMGNSFPLGFSLVDSRGGINLIWRNQEFDKEVKIKIAANNQLQSYVYYYQGDDSKLINLKIDTATDYLSNLLLWLSNNNSIDSL